MKLNKTNPEKSRQLSAVLRIGHNVLFKHPIHVIFFAVDTASKTFPWIDINRSDFEYPPRYER